MIVLNKVDRMKPEEIAAQIDAASKLGDFHALHPVSARTGSGMTELRDELVGLLPEGPAYFPTDQRSDLPVEVQVAEIIREKALALTREEVPHALSVEVEDLGDKVVRAVVYVETQSRKESSSARAGTWYAKSECAPGRSWRCLLGRRIFLELQVKVKEKWRSDERMLEQLGL